MDYIPKTNWVYGEVLGHAAMNRIEGGLGFALDQVTAQAHSSVQWFILFEL